MAHSRLFILAVALCTSSALPGHHYAIQPVLDKTIQLDSYGLAYFCNDKCKKNIFMRDFGVCLFGPHTLGLYDIIVSCKKKCQRRPKFALPDTGWYDASKANRDKTATDADAGTRLSRTRESFDNDPEFTAYNPAFANLTQHGRLRNNKDGLSPKYCETSCKRNIRVSDAAAVFGTYEDSPENIVTAVFDQCKETCMKVPMNHLPGSATYDPPPTGPLAGFEVTCDEDGAPQGDMERFREIVAQALSASISKGSGEEPGEDPGGESGEESGEEPGFRS